MGRVLGVSCQGCQLEGALRPHLESCLRNSGCLAYPRQDEVSVGRPCGPGARFRLWGR